MADEDYQSNNDGDSAFDDKSTMSETATVESSLMKVREENGRTYHTYGLWTSGKRAILYVLGMLNIAGSTDYWGPNDDRAQDQQDIRSVQHFSLKCVR